MVTNADHLHALMTLQRALERSFDSDWLRGSTAGTGSFPPINIFQQGEDFVAIAELPGVSKTDIEIQVQDKKRIDIPLWAGAAAAAVGGLLLLKRS